MDVWGFYRQEEENFSAAETKLPDAESSPVLEGCGAQLPWHSLAGRRQR